MDLALAVRAYEEDGSEYNQSRLNEILENMVLADGWQQELIMSALTKLLSVVDIYSPLAWNVLRTVETFCNSTTQDSTLALQKLVPTVTRLTKAAVTEERKLRILRVLQSLTYGIHIARSDSFLGPLIAVLVEWSKDRNHKSVVQLSLSVLINLLHRNTVVLSTLIQTVNLKDFMNSVLRTRSDILCRMEVLELMILLEDLFYEKPNEVEIVNFIKVSICTLMDFKASKLQMQHCVLFFIDMVKEGKITSAHLDQPWFPESVTKIISMLDDGIDSIEPAKCMLLFKFLKIFVDMGISSLSPSFFKLVQLGVAYALKHKNQAVEAIDTINAILLTYPVDGCSTICGFTEDDVVQVIIPLLGEGVKEKFDFIFLTSVVSLCCSALEFKKYQGAFIENLRTEMIESLLKGLPEKLHKINYSDSSEHHIKMCIHIFHFVYKMVCCDGSWARFYTCLFNDERFLSVLAVALVQGATDLKSKVLPLIGSVGFPKESLVPLAMLMTECGKSKLSGDDDAASQTFVPASTAFSANEIKTLMSSVKDSIKQNKDLPMTDVFLLYEYKEQLNLDYQKSLVDSLSKSTRQIAMLQEEARTANQIASAWLHELDTLRPAFHVLRKKQETTLATLNERDEELNGLRKRLSEESSSCQRTVSSLTETVEKQNKEISLYCKNTMDLKTELQRKVDACSNYEEELKEKDSANLLLQKKLDDLLKEQEEGSEKMDSLEKEVERLNTLLVSKGKEISVLETEKIAKSKEIQDLQRIKEMVYEITGGRKKLP